MNNVKNIVALFALALLTTACGASNQSAIKAAPISVPAAAPAAASSEAPAEAEDATPEAPAEKAAETPEEKSATETGDNAMMFNPDAHKHPVFIDVAQQDTLINCANMPMHVACGGGPTVPMPQNPQHGFGPMGL